MAVQFLETDVEYYKMCHQKEENAFGFAVLLVFISANREAMTLLPWLWKMISCFPVLFVWNRMYFEHLAKSVCADELGTLALLTGARGTGDVQCLDVSDLSNLFSTWFRVLRAWGCKGSTTRLTDSLLPRICLFSHCFAWSCGSLLVPGLPRSLFKQQAQELDVLLC